MDLKDFVRDTLVQINAGVAEAQTQVSESVRGNSEVNPRFSKWKDGETLGFVDNETPIFAVSFDVAVAVTEGSQASAGGGIKVVGINIGADGQVSGENASTSRVRFRVPITLPRQE